MAAEEVAYFNRASSSQKQSRGSERGEGSR